MLYLLYHPGYETGLNLSQELKKVLGSKFERIRSPKKLKKIQSQDILIRWGDTRFPDLDNLFKIIYNKSNAIIKNTNKLRSLKIFKDNEINVPKFYQNKIDIQKFPVLGRNRHHYGGKDIIFINGDNNLKRNNFNKIPNKDFYVEFIESKDEYRIHIFNNKAIRVTRKVFRGHDRDGNAITKKGLIKNDTFGWGHHNVVLDNVPNKYIKEAVKAINALGLNFGAVDLLVDKKDKPYILEVNSSPRLNSIGLEIYIRLFSNLVSNKKEIFLKW